MLNLILALIFGITLGVSIENVFNKRTKEQDSKLIKSYKGLIAAKDERIKSEKQSAQYYIDSWDELYGMYNESLNGIDELVAENIKLKKKLKAYE